MPDREETLPAAQTTEYVVKHSKFKEIIIVCWGFKVTTDYSLSEVSFYTFFFFF